MSSRKKLRSPEVSLCIRIRNDFLDRFENGSVKPSLVSDYAYRVFFLHVLSKLSLIPDALVMDYIFQGGKFRETSSAERCDIGSLPLPGYDLHSQLCRNSLLKNDLTEIANAIIGIPISPPRKDWTLDSRIYLLCESFEAFKARPIRKERGSFYTPPWLAKKICEESLAAAMEEMDTSGQEEQFEAFIDLKILDNACGGGVFLLAALDAILGEIIRTTGFDLQSTSSLVERLLTGCIFGSDIDSQAVSVANAVLWCAHKSLNDSAPPLDLIGKNLLVGDSLLQTDLANKFHILVGNPPYFRLSRLDSHYREKLSNRYSITREYNAHALFLEASLRALRKKGVLGLLLHKNLFTLNTYRDLRKSIVNSFELCNLIDCGSGVFSHVTAETCVLILRKNNAKPESNLRLSECNTVSEQFETISTIPLHKYLEVVQKWNFRYLVRLSSLHIDLLLHLASLPSLSERVSISRGIETGDNERFLSKIRNGPQWKPIVRGRDIRRYQISDGSFIHYRPSSLAKPGRSDLLGIPKVVLRQNAMSPIAAFDPGRRLVLNSVTYLSDAAPDLLKSLCIILNSRFIKHLFRLILTNNSKVTVNILPNNLGAIPIPMNIDTMVFSRFYDMITAFQPAGKASLSLETEYSIQMDTISEALVLEAYFPRLMNSESISEIRKKITCHPNIQTIKNQFLNPRFLSTINALVKKVFTQMGFPLS